MFVKTTNCLSPFDNVVIDSFSIENTETVASVKLNSEQKESNPKVSSLRKELHHHVKTIFYSYSEYYLFIPKAWRDNRYSQIKLIGPWKFRFSSLPYNFTKKRCFGCKKNKNNSTCRIYWMLIWTILTKMSLFKIVLLLLIASPCAASFSSFCSSSTAPAISVTCLSASFVDVYWIIHSNIYVYW